MKKFNPIVNQKSNFSAGVNYERPTVISAWPLMYGRFIKRTHKLAVSEFVSSFLAISADGLFRNQYGAIGIIQNRMADTAQHNLSDCA